MFAAWIFTATPARAEAMWLPLAFVQGGFAALIAHWRKNPPWWIAIHLVFLPLVVVMLRLGLPPAFYLAAFLLLLLVFWRLDLSRVPLYLSSLRVAPVLASRLPAAARLLDLGCGDGRLLAALARQRPDCIFVGIEHAPLPWAIARWRCRRLANVVVRYGDFWQEPLASYDLVYAFLSPAPMAALWAKSCAEMKDESLLVSNSFPIPGVAPEEVIEVGGQKNGRLFFYRPSAVEKTLESSPFQAIRSSAHDQ
ncbi:MAG: class I SAM-dependent methyltransferase [Rhodocyclaceae bacterium]|nr:class I SAM-dependent methyltransferase [Rhodocyclaceae bacterium]